MTKDQQLTDLAADAPIAANKSQFGILAIFWLTFIIGLAITYLQRIDEPSLIMEGLASVVIGLAIGFVVGLLAQQIQASIIWATLIAAFGFLCVASDASFQMPIRIAWAVVGAVSGATGASVWVNRFPLNGLVSAVSALAVMCIYTLVIVGKATPVQLVDIVAAPVIGFLVASLIQILHWLEKRVNTSRYFMATMLMIMIIIGTLFVGGLGRGAA